MAFANHAGLPESCHILTYSDSCALLEARQASSSALSSFAALLPYRKLAQLPRSYVIRIPPCSGSAATLGFVTLQQPHWTAVRVHVLPPDTDDFPTRCQGEPTRIRTVPKTCQPKWAVGLQSLSHGRSKKDLVRNANFSRAADKLIASVESRITCTASFEGLHPIRFAGIAGLQDFCLCKWLGDTVKGD